jgi:hypothetical protein
VSVAPVETTVEGSTTLSSIGINNTDTLIIKNAQGNTIYSGSNLSEKTLDELISLISTQASSQGGTITGSLTNGLLSFDSPSGYRIEGTIADKDSIAELQAQQEQITSVCYNRAYRIMKSKIEAAQELLASCKKVLTRRCQELELTHLQGR